MARRRRSTALDGSLPEAPPIPTSPQWETRAKRPLPGGRWPGIDNSLWLWRVAPLGPVVDARSPRDAVDVGRPLLNAYAELAALAGRGVNRRQAKGSYRQTHALLLNIPAPFRAAPDSPIREWLDRQFGHASTLDRVLLLGVKLKPSAVRGGWRRAIDSIAETIQFGGAPISDFDADYEEVDALLARHGFTVPGREMLHLADAWWNLGRTAGVPVIAHEEHIHYFHTVGSARRAVKTDPADCSAWHDERRAGQIEEHAITFASVEDFDLRYTPVDHPLAQWVVPLMDLGARVVSIRAAIEPSRITRGELRRQQRRYQADLNELAAEGKLERAEIAEREAELRSIERLYADGDAPPTLVDASVIIGFDGVIDDLAKLLPGGPLTLAPMLNRQAAAWHETMVCSNVRANPLLHDLPATTIAFSGLPDLTQVGDRTGALLGISERDRQPVYISPTAAAEGDREPLLYVMGATGSGKSLTMQHLAYQWHLAGVPQLVVNPKQGASLRDFAEAAGGTVASLSDFVSSDGALDPLRIIPDRVDAITKATSMIAAVNPFGPSISQVMTDLAYGIDYGVKAGAQATGQALQIALRDGAIGREVADPVFRFADVFPMFRATFGLDPQSPPMSLSHGLTLVEVGDTAFDLPPAGWQGEPSALQSPTQRLSLNLIRMLLWGGMSALRGRGGVIHLDESWIVEKAAPGDLDQIGRLARAWNVLPIMYTQRPTGPLGIGLKGYISRGLIGHINDEQEAAAALDLFGLADNATALRRITAGETLSGGKGLNFDSLKALKDEETGRVVRGAVWYHVDLRGRVAPVEVTLGPELLGLFSTTPAEVARRRQQKGLAQS